MASKFELGTMLATPGALEALRESNETPQKFFQRHASGDWGEVCPDDWAANEAALVNGDRLLSVYRTTLGGEKLWLITEADRSSSTLLRPGEY